MNVLWFANTPCNSDEFLNTQLTGTGGWLKSLDKEIQDDVSLSVVFYWDYLVKPFTYKNTKYFPIYRGGYFVRMYERFFTHLLDDNHINEYLDIIEIVKPDIIHIHGTENSYCCLIDKISIPVVVSIQGNITVYNHMYFSGIEEKYLKVRNFSLNKPQGFFKRFKKHYKLFNRMKDREQKYISRIKNVIGRTNWDFRITELLCENRKYYHNDEILRESFYNSINAWSFNNRQIKAIFTTSGPSYYKGLETIIFTANLLKDKGIDFIWKIAGIRPEDLIVRVVKKKLKKRFSLDNIVFLGNLDEKQLLSNLLETDVYVMPSHIENSPNNLCEAMMLGIPCVATFSGGTPSLLDDGKEGILVQNGDPYSMSGALIEYFNNPTKMVTFGRNASYRAEKRHSREKITKDLINIYTQVINKI